MNDKSEIFLHFDGNLRMLLKCFLFFAAYSVQIFFFPSSLCSFSKIQKMNHIHIIKVVPKRFFCCFLKAVKAIYNPMDQKFITITQTDT